MKSYEIAASYAFNNSLFAESSLFYNHIDNKLKQQGDPQKWVNSGWLNTKGGELSVRYSNGSLDCFANYTYTDSKDEENKRSDEIAMHTFNAGVNYKIDSHYRVNLRTNYVGAKNNPALIPTTGDNRVEPYWLANGQLSYLDFFGADIYLSVANLFDKEYYHTSNRSVTRYRQPQRSVMARAEYHF
jgi:outer membrane receptor for monomeric catechols